jgi:hypothetical protein
MAEITIEPTSGVAVVTVPDDVAADLAEVFEILSKPPKNRAANQRFETAEEAKLFMRQARKWCADNELTFTRRDASETGPLHVRYRITRPEPLTEEEKAARAAKRAANAAGA